MKTAEIAEKILPVYLKIQQAHGKDYSFAAQTTLLFLLLKHRGWTKSRATLNRWLRRLEDEGYIKRIRRIKNHPLYGLMFKSTICTILLKGYHSLRKLGLNVWKEINALLDKLRNKYPEFAARSRKKETPANKFDPKGPGVVKKILNGFGKAFSLVW